jgi:mannose-6-phosphate isomerase-like protein (cupin superfamily)
MTGFNINIEKETLKNINFRKVLYTGKHSQLVVMSLKPKEEIGMETHKDNDQFFRFEQGHGQCIIDDSEYSVVSGTAIIIPAGAKHNIINTSKTQALKMYTIYSPPHHKDGVTRITKEQAEAKENKEEFDGVTTE